MPPNIQWMNRGFTKIQTAAIQLLKWRLKDLKSTLSSSKSRQKKSFVGGNCSAGQTSFTATMQLCYFAIEHTFHLQV